jgi:spoIIIJ-associated protein
MMEKIRDIVKNLIEKLAVTEADVEVSESHGAWIVSITSPDEHTLVGRDNDKYEALSHLLKRMLAKELGEEAKIIVDINGMRAKNEEALKVKAKMVAGRAREFKTNVEMDPMSSYERMLVHSALQDEPNIKTESVGEGRNRRLVVKYVEG